MSGPGSPATGKGSGSPTRSPVSYRHQATTVTVNTLASTPDGPVVLEQKPPVTFEEAIEAVGIGRTQIMLMLICGFTFCSDAVEITYLSYVTVVLRCEWQLEPWQESLIGSSVFFGTILGAPFWGYLGDTVGRRPTFLLSAGLIGIFGFATALCEKFISLVLVRSLVGFAVAGMPISFDILAEALPVSGRGRFLLYVEFFWTFGSIWVTLVAFASLVQAGWQVFTILSAVPAVISFVAGFPLMSESPRWLVSQGREAEALVILNRWAENNNIDTRFHEIVPENTCEKERGCCSSASLLRGRVVKNLAVMSVVWFGFDMAYYGIVMLLPRLFHKGGSHRACDLNFGFKDLFIASGAEIIGVFIGLAMVDRAGRRLSQGVWYAVAAVCLGLIGWQFLSEQVLTFVAILGRVAMMVASCVTWVHTPELFPTRIRATSHAWLNLASKVGASAAPFLISGIIPLRLGGLIMGAVCLLAALAMFLLPETRHLALSDACAEEPTCSSTNLCVEDCVDDSGSSSSGVDF